ncbi:MAG TPA: DUF2855 family protein [Ideonella sp.]|uniref:DUF2855 family protein n=1 Tax=Ideonella sp. TaxID=1929293 RepID=UPI002E376381|nr:DUF2855 family protein [Ideonella sp.]HEX5688313.1 DUF2855 family protein [Ideonella sp.]
MQTIRSLVVARGDLARTDTFEQARMPMEEGEVLLKIDRFAFTANNVTYGETGDSLGYWQFYPAPEGWGHIPVWGFADVVESRCNGIAPGERLYGFLPMATHLRLRPQRLSEASFIDATAHRQALPKAYNLYLRTASDPSYRREDEDLQALLRPMFITSFLIDDLLADEGFFGATCVVLSSASAKTAIGLAFLLHRRGGVEVVGLTSAGNRGFVAELGCYDRVVTYDELATLPLDRATVYVDFAGSATLRQRVHEHLGDRLLYSSAVGLAHRDTERAKSRVPGVKPIFFFAPDRLRKRAQDWGRDGLEPRVSEQWRGFVAAARGWLTVRHGQGFDAVQAAYAQALAGRVPPNVGVMLSLG